jgi:AcrR family transcriptional regulator
VIAEVGYETATMSQIADRAGACIGSLYQFFPNKQVLTQALRAKYGREIHQIWAQLEAQCASLSIDQMVSHLTTGMIAFVEEYPAFLRLLDAPSYTRSTPIRQLLRRQLARCFVNMRPGLPPVQAFQIASVCLQIVKGMNQLYSETRGSERKVLVDECRLALTCYLNFRLASGRHVMKRLGRK